MKYIFSFKQVIGAFLIVFVLASVVFETSNFVKAAGIKPAAWVSISSSSMTVKVDPSGKYRIDSVAPAWTFGSTIGLPLSNVTINTGSDTVGSYQEIDFNYQDLNSAARGGGIRLYASKPVVLFTDTYLSATNNTLPFPRLTIYPKNLYHLTYVGAFAQASFSQYGADSPWMYFDTNANTFVLSPASDFMIASTTRGGDGSIYNGIDPTITTLPQGFTHKTILVVGQHINKVYEAWGHALTDLQGKTRPPNNADKTLAYLGYWTDHGSAYWYRYDHSLGYAGTLLAVKNSFTQQHIPLGYMQLDGWWYPKGSPPKWSNHRSGIYTYTASTTLFPNGLAAFQQQLGLPLVTQAKWIDPSSPYRSQYTMSNNLSTDPLYWSMLAASLKSSEVITYEQDFLDALDLPVINLTDPEAFVDNMASAMAANGITMQYATELPRYFLQSSRYNNFLTARVSPDHFTSQQWDRFLYTSHLASALGIWPWSDVVTSTDTDSLLLSTLSAGMVGVGDPVGTVDTTNLLRVIRADGQIVKPDVPIVPIDSTYMQDAQGLGTPMVAFTYTDFGGGMRPLYVFAYSRGSNTTATFTPANLGLTDNVYVYNYFTGTGTIVQAGQTYTDTAVTTGSYYLVVPIGPSGIGFLGDSGKFVSLGKKRFTQVSDTGSLQAQLAFASGETSITVAGYSPTTPMITASDGAVGTISYNSATQLFSVPISPGADGAAAITVTHS